MDNTSNIVKEIASNFTNVNLKDENCWIIDTSYNSCDKFILPYLIKALNVIAITTVSSDENLSPLTIKLNIEKDLNSKIPVFAGADRPFINYQKELKDEAIINPYNWTFTQDSNKTTNIQEKNQIEFQEYNNIGLKLANKASVKITEFVRAFKSKVNILALGPLTNLSLAILLDSTLEKSFKNLYIVGGSYNNLGNSGTCAEFNFRSDPVASKNTMLYYKNIILIPLEVEEQIKLNADLSNLKSTNNPNSNFIKNGLSQNDIRDEEALVNSFLGIIGSIIAVNPNTIKVKSVKPCDIDIYGRYTRGAMLVEKYEHLKTGNFNDVTIVDEINVEEVIKILNDILS